MQVRLTETSLDDFTCHKGTYPVVHGNQSVITDDDGKVILNLAQQDCVALRCVFRAGFQIANPITSLQSDKAKRFPAGVITPAAA